jgi:hypothetical protein
MDTPPETTDPPKKKPKPKPKKKKKSSDPLKKFFDKLMKPINKIIGYFKCGIDKIKNLYYCIIFYIIYIIISIAFMIWNLSIGTITGITAGNNAWSFIRRNIPKKIVKCFLC